MLALGLFSLGAALVLYMGWFGSAEIAHRDFDLGGFLISGALLIWLAFKGWRKSVNAK
jgi:hypothetical protein